MTNSGDLDFKKNVIFGKNTDGDPAGNGTVIDDHTFPENTAVILSVGVGYENHETMRIVAMSSLWADLLNFSILGADILAFTCFDRISIRIVENEDLEKYYHVEEKFMEELKAELRGNYESI